MTRLAAGVLAVVGASACFEPSFTEGAACTSDRICPEGQVCADDNRCYSPGNEPARDASPGDAASDAAPPDAANCPPGSAGFADSCYRFVSVATDWPDALSQCVNAGAHLVTIATPEENEFVRSLSAGIQWIGLSDTDVEGAFEWVTGEPLVFESWRANEPSNSGNEDCVVQHVDAAWNDLACDDLRVYVCEAEL